jgi:hypothetical protein
MSISLIFALGVLLLFGIGAFFFALAAAKSLPPKTENNASPPNRPATLTKRERQTPVPAGAAQSRR